MRRFVDPRKTFTKAHSILEEHIDRIRMVMAQTPSFSKARRACPLSEEGPSFPLEWDHEVHGPYSRLLLTTVGNKPFPLQFLKLWPFTGNTWSNWKHKHGLVLTLSPWFPCSGLLRHELGNCGSAFVKLGDFWSYRGIASNASTRTDGNWDAVATSSHQVVRGRIQENGLTIDCSLDRISKGKARSGAEILVAIHIYFVAWFQSPPPQPGHFDLFDSNLQHRIYYLLFGFLDMFEWMERFELWMDWRNWYWFGHSTSFGVEIQSFNMLQYLDKW